ncbi:MAG: DUF2062 domain-containing protein [Vicinamibacterales bacterium]
MPPAPPPTPAAARVRRFARELRTEAATPARRAAAVGLGVFIGCTPFYGLHLAISYGLAWLFGLSRLTVYLFANISNPFVAPFLVFAEVQVGRLVRGGAFYPLTVDALRTMRPWTFGADLLAGAAVVGALLGVGMGLVVYQGLRRRPVPDPFERLAFAAADRYVDGSFTAWEFGRGKLRGDPVYRAALCEARLPSGGTLVDFGCGQGLMLAVLAEAADAHASGDWSPSPPVFDRLIGVESRANVANLARLALGNAAEIHEIDGRDFVFPPCRVVLCFDVLHMMPPADQARLLVRMRDALEPGGVLLVRDADAGSPRVWRVRVGNRAKAILLGAWRQPLCFRGADDWTALFTSLGLSVERVEGDRRGAFGNVLFRLSRPPAA